MFHNKDSSDSFFSRFLMLPFRIISPPILDTPLSTISIPSTFLTVPILLLSFGATIGGFVYCWVKKSSWERIIYNEKGQSTSFLLVPHHLHDQSLTEAFIVGGIFGLGGLSLVAAYVVLKAEKKTGLFYGFTYLYGMTFPVWAILSYEIFKMKFSNWDLEFFPRKGMIPQAE
jgi:hypothetical protein